MANFYSTIWAAICRNCGREYGFFGVSGPKPYNKNETPEGKKMKNVRTCLHCAGPCDWHRTDQVIERKTDEVAPKLAVFKAGSGRKPNLTPCPNCGEGVSVRERRGTTCPHCGERFSSGRANGAANA